MALMAILSHLEHYAFVLRLWQTVVSGQVPGHGWTQAYLNLLAKFFAYRLEALYCIMVGSTFLLIFSVVLGRHRRPQSGVLPQE
jgi:hypothetical protein